jgi:hypothetical protein
MLTTAMTISFAAQWPCERTEVLYGTDKVINEELQFFSKSKG